MKKIILILLTIILLAFSINIQADQSDIEIIQQQQNEAVENLSQVENDQMILNSQIANVKEQLVECLASIDILNNQISDLENQITETEQNLALAQQTQQVEYEAMKKRIQYIYEEGGEAGWLVILIENSNIMDLLNQTEYTESLYKYDRQCLQEYAEIAQQIAEYKISLEEQQTELQESKSAQEEESNYLQELLSNLNLTSAQYDELINSLNNDIINYQNQIDKMNEELQAYAEQQRIAEEQAQIQAEIQEQEETIIEESTYKIEEEYTIPQISSDSTIGQAIVDYALQFVGNPYVYGGNSLTNGIDCSGFTQQIYAAFGYSLPRSSAAQRSVGVEVSVDDLQIGDLICYYGHVAIYIGGTSIVHASNETVGIIVSDNFAYREIASIRRII